MYYNQMLGGGRGGGEARGEELSTKCLSTIYLPFYFRCRIHNPIIVILLSCFVLNSLPYKSLSELFYAGSTF